MPTRAIATTLSRPIRKDKRLTHQHSTSAVGDVPHFKTLEAAVLDNLGDSGSETLIRHNGKAQAHVENSPHFRIFDFAQLL